MNHELTHNQSDLTDAGLIHSYQVRGCRDALNRLVERHLGAVRQLVFSMVLDDAVADDLTQDVFVRAIRGLPKFEQKAEFSTWLFRIALNVTYSHFDRKHQPQNNETHLTGNLIAQHPLPEQNVAAKELESEIERALAALSPPLRAAMVLTCLQGLSPETAAEIERCSVSTMYWRIHEARKQLKSQLKRYLA